MRLSDRSAFYSRTGLRISAVGGLKFAKTADANVVRVILSTATGMARSKHAPQLATWSVCIILAQGTGF